MLAILGTVLLVGIAGSTSNRERQNVTNQSNEAVLARAKEALIGYAVQVSNGGDGYRMGGLPMPDILNTAGTAFQYDGDGSNDFRCLSTTATGFPAVSNGAKNPNKFCIGKFPWKQLGADFGIVEPHDPLGVVPWIAVSSNLLSQDVCLTVLNSETLSLTYSGFVCPTLPARPTSLPYPWFTVRDASGGVLSDRVAAVLIIPGAAIANEFRAQSRTAASPGGVKDYLDAIRLPLGCQLSCTTVIDNADLSGQFVSLTSSTRYPANAENASLRGLPISFNDIVAYITIDELMAAFQRRVLSEMRNSLVSYKATTGLAYPWAAQFSKPDAYTKFMSKPATYTGLLPFFPATTSPTPSSGYPAFPTEFSWSIENIGSASVTNCVPVSGGFIDTRDAVAFRQTIGGTATCTWKGTNDLSCDYTLPAPETTSVTFRKYNTAARCRNKNIVGLVGNQTENVAVTNLVFNAAATCSNPTISYLAGSATEYSTWSWGCAVVANQFDVVTAAYSIPGIGVSESSASFNGVGKKVGINKMRYQPQMPYWYYQNDWYLTGFYGVAAASAPANLSPCGVKPSITVDGVDGAAAAVILGGARFPNPPLLSTQSRPSNSLNDYLEDANLSASTNCTFSSVTASPSTTNDYVLKVSP
jgi:hypothetical protein